MACKKCLSCVCVTPSDCNHNIHSKFTLYIWFGAEFLECKLEWNPTTGDFPALAMDVMCGSFPMLPLFRVDENPYIPCLPHHFEAHGIRFCICRRNFEVGECDCGPKANHTRELGLLGRVVVMTFWLIHGILNVLRDAVIGGKFCRVRANIGARDYIVG